LRGAEALFDNRLTVASVPKRRASKAGARDSRAALLRAVPPVGECLRAAERIPAFDGLSRAYLKTTVTRALDALREAIIAGRDDIPQNRPAMTAATIREAEAALRRDEPALRTVVNATGVVLHTNLGRALLAEPAIEALERAARAPVNLEYDLEEGTRGDRDSIVERELCALSGAEAATVVNNNAAAVLLALNSLAAGMEVIVSRGELIEIGGAFRLPEVMARSGVRLREVGTTNRTHPRDYESAIGPETAMLLKVHPSNYRIIGFTKEVSLAELVRIGRARGVPVMEDLGAGALIDLSAYGLPREPIVAERVAAGADLVSFSADKLLGGPQGGIVVGRRPLVDQLKTNPLKRALRCGKLTIAALSATLGLYLRSGDLASELPALRILTRTIPQMREVAGRARDILAERLPPPFAVEIVDSKCQIGSGALPTEELDSVAIRVTRRDMSANAIAELFRHSLPPVIGRVTDDAFQLDLRTIEDPSALAVSFPIRQQHPTACAAHPPGVDDG
jgi:L-seryl-tRNA(Ser) seleniumtransferase